MQVRGAPLIGATAAYGIALAVAEDPSDAGLDHAATVLAATRPTAVNLALGARRDAPRARRPAAAGAASSPRSSGPARSPRRMSRSTARSASTALALIGPRSSQGRVPRRSQVLTHCNAGWLATVDWGTALAPIYRAHDAGIPLHVWVDETRPRNQGAEPDGLGAGPARRAAHRHRRQCRRAPDAARPGRSLHRRHRPHHRVGRRRNKIGTYLKALAARDNDVPFYVALPSPTIDWTIDDGAAIPIEERDPREVTHIAGWTEDGERIEVRLTPAGSPAANFAFDVTPARLVTALITERGVCPASRDGLLGLFPERREQRRNRGAA